MLAAIAMLESVVTSLQCDCIDLPRLPKQHSGARILSQQKQLTLKVLLLLFRFRKEGKMPVKWLLLLAAEDDSFVVEVEKSGS